MGNYLYGASVQGIQEFIFKTNQLQEIVGASEIVKSIDTMIDAYEPHEILMQAAGNIKAIFDDKEKLEKVVREFPKKIMQKAYGITISQAVVKMEGKFSEQSEAIKELEKRLKTQRNKPSIPLDLTINIMELAPKTARPKVNQNGDKSTTQKIKASEKFYKDNPETKEFKSFDYMKNTKGKIAIIHADGNGLGAIVPKLGDKLSHFSTKLNDATTAAFNNAKTETMEVRKIILGGDDMTVVCNANDALEFTKNFLYQFEEETKKIQELNDVGFTKLTACAGIAYCNEKFPFHYAVDLAEALCSATKKHAKKLVEDKKDDKNNPIPAPSSLMFHNVQSSNFQSWEKFIKDELTIKNDQETIRCDFGAYYANQEGQASIENLIATLQAYAQEGSPISSLRSWMSELHKSHQSADNMLKRIDEMASKNPKWDHEAMDKTLKKLHSELSTKTLIVSKDKEKDCHGVEKELLKTPIYDVLQILSATEAK